MKDVHIRLAHAIQWQIRLINSGSLCGCSKLIIEILKIVIIHFRFLLVKKPLPPKPIAIKKPVVADETKSVFGKAPSPQKKTKQAFSDEDAESTEPSALRQIVQTVLRRMESIFGVEE